MIDYISILGKNIYEISLDGSEYSLTYNDSDLNEGIEPGWIARANDERFEMMLSPDKTIRTIFLYPIQARFDALDLSAEIGREYVLEKFGAPSKSGEEMDFSVLGKTGGFDRYDYESYSIHFEYLTRQNGLKMLTLMTPDVVKDL